MNKRDDRIHRSTPSRTLVFDAASPRARQLASALNDHRAHDGRLIDCDGRVERSIVGAIGGYPGDRDRRPPR
jgi:hypothetical protein